MKSFLSLLAACAVTAASAASLRGNDVEAVFDAFVSKFGKSYDKGSAEYQLRLAAFEVNLGRIQQGNAVELQAGNADMPFGLNKFSDWTQAELSRLRNYKPLADRDAIPPSPIFEHADSLGIPGKVDWRDHTPSVISPVKNQGQCGSCWAFSATEGVESYWALGGHDLPKLAPQQIVSCDDKDDGCNGGDLPTAFEYVKKTGGMESESEWPYRSGITGLNGKCKAIEQSDLQAPVKDWFKGTVRKNETELQVSVAHVGPQSICVDASTWDSYTGGVVKRNCGTELDHCVQLVGYDVSDTGVPYWIVRNSWGADWGIDGYIHIEIGSDLCGIAKEAYYVTF